MKDEKTERLCFCKIAAGIFKGFLYETIFVPEGVEPPDRPIVERVGWEKKTTYAIIKQNGFQLSGLRYHMSIKTEF